MKKLFAVVSVSALVPSLAMAQATSLLPADLVENIGQVGVDITTVGMAIIGIAVIALAIRWIKATFF